MAKRRKHTDSWIQVVTILTVLGLIALGALGVYFFMQQRSEKLKQSQEEISLYKQKEQRRHKKIANNKSWQNRWVRPLSPERVQVLERQVELPLEVIRCKPGYMRPKNRREYVRNRIDRLENNIDLLKKTQRQEQALKDLERRIKALQMIDTLY